MSVQSELVRETIVNTICERALARADDPLSPAVAEALDAAPHPELARAGYFARVAETELFEPAREPAAWLQDELRSLGSEGSPWPSGVTEVAGRLADGEPLERPDPGNADAVSWRIAGPGGHVRHYVAQRLSGDRPGSKRDVTYGFVVRCCEEIADPRLYVYNT